MISLSESAGLKVKEMMKEANETMLHFGVTGGGCSGLSYSLGFITEVTEEDVVFVTENITVVVKKADLPIISGTIIGYKESMMGGGFTIDNPNAIASCGCGSSFRTKNEAGNPEQC
jgi:iron-sulfur cluster assembly protein